MLIVTVAPPLVEMPKSILDLKWKVIMILLISTATNGKSLLGSDDSTDSVIVDNAEFTDPIYLLSGPLSCCSYKENFGLGLGI